jgi:HK97 gp10 family phage protein
MSYRRPRLHGHERKKREKKKRGYFGIVGPVREFRHAEHGIHHVEHFLAGKQAHAIALAKAQAKLRAVGVRQITQSRQFAMLRPGLARAMVTERGEAGARAFLRAALARGFGRGGPLVLTIGVTVNMEDMDDVPDEVLEEIESDIHSIMETTMLNTVSEAQSLAPVRTGTLRSSINGTMDETALMITFIANTGYAIYQEDGTSKMAPNPYLREPVAEAEESMNEQIDYSLLDHLDGNVEGEGDDPTVDLELETEMEFIVE